ncbi:Single-stranded DNA-binding protein [compost metagenome]
MQTIGFTGLIYGLKETGKKGKDGYRVNFRLGVRKSYVSDEDKKAGKTQTFIPMVAFGKTAEFIMDYFEDGKPITVTNVEYNTWESSDNGKTEYFHNFRVGQAGFVPGTGDNNGGGGNGGGGGKSSSRRRDDDDDDRGSRSSRSSSRRSRDEDEDDDRGSRRSSGGSRRNRDDDDDDDRGNRRSSGSSRGRSRDDDDDDDDNVPF